jgi:hypothetical protein
MPTPNSPSAYGVYDPGVYSITMNTTLAGPVLLLPGATFEIDEHIILSVNGPFEAPRAQVFTGLGKVRFADGAVDEIRPEWWGFGASATAATNDVARRKARDSITLRGTVRFPAGSFLVSDYVPIDRSYIRFVGDARFGTVFVTTSAVGDVTGIDGTAFNPLAPQRIDECQHLGIGVQRDVDGAATKTAGIPTGAKGFVHRLTANAMIEGRFIDNPIDYYEAQTTSARVDIQTAHSARGLAGDVRYGVVSDCTLAGDVKASANGSSYKRIVDHVDPAYPGESWGVLSYGVDLRDGFWQSVETSGGDHAWDIVGAPIGAADAFDIHLLFCVLDGWRKSGLRIMHLPANSRLNIGQGYSAPGAVGPEVGPSVQILDSSGVTIGRGFEAKGAANNANHTAVSIEEASARFVIECSITGAKVGVRVDNASLGLIAVSCEPHAGQRMEAAIQLRNHASRVLISGGIIDGEGGVTYGVHLDDTSTYNTIGAYNINKGTVDNPVFINGANIASLNIPNGPPSPPYRDVNHNRVLTGVLDDGL